MFYNQVGVKALWELWGNNAFPPMLRTSLASPLMDPAVNTSSIQYQCLKEKQHLFTVFCLKVVHVFHPGWICRIIAVKGHFALRLLLIFSCSQMHFWHSLSFLIEVYYHVHTSWISFRDYDWCWLKQTNSFIFSDI